MRLDEEEMDGLVLKYAKPVLGIIACIIIVLVIASIVMGALFPQSVQKVQGKTAITPTPTPGEPDNIVLDIISPVVVLKGSKQYAKLYPTPTPNVSVVVVVETITPEPTPTPRETVIPIPTSIVHTVNPFDGGERWERQWYRWHWSNVSGLQSADRGIVVYRHLYLDSYSYWNDAWGQYFNVFPSAGNRFLAVYVHQEDFSPDNSGIWGYPNSSFKLQYNGALHDQWTGFDPVYRIADLEEHYNDYYNINRALPYGSYRVYGGFSDAKTGGYHVEWWKSLWSGKGNAWDGYILYEVPVWVNDKDIRINGYFAGKQVNWRFDADVDIPKEFPIQQIGTLPMTPVPIARPVETPIEQRDDVKWTRA